MHFCLQRYVADGNNAIQVKEFVRDSIRPIMTSFKLDMSEKLLTLIFSKPISIKSIDLNQLGLRSSKTTTTSTEYIEFSPTMASVATKKDSYVISIVLTEATYFTLQHFPTLAKYASTSLITMTNTFATDTVEPIPNPVFEISNSEAVKVFDMDLIDLSSFPF